MPDLCADGAAGKGMIRIPFDRHHPSLFHAHKEPAGVRAIVWAHGAFIAQFHLSQALNILPITVIFRFFLNIRKLLEKRQGAHIGTHDFVPWYMLLGLVSPLGVIL